jgi:hypothetical protein
MERRQGRSRLVPWLAVSFVVMGVLVIAYLRDEVPLGAPLLMATAFLLGAIDYVWPQLQLLASLLFRGLFVGVALEASAAVFGDASFDALAALGAGAAISALTGLWEYFRGGAPEPA